eukprot:CAMPEP_0198683620 /NCGR_PEP_ID=MMETSP1468-20131203/10934_1 /TAXON_ID=1461545 /ORGANISM="Mantoniella sp, Strain CCMP1436" /LENGTH=216 /DNA_ID=CAMNT_0044427775 /DNA_START=608 /DNA_END=1255 /DNA_ORIENTATION=+
MLRATELRARSVALGALHSLAKISQFKHQRCFATTLTLIHNSPATLAVRLEVLLERREDHANAGVVGAAAHLAMPSGGGGLKPRKLCQDLRKRADARRAPTRRILTSDRWCQPREVGEELGVELVNGVYGVVAGHEMPSSVAVPLLSTVSRDWAHRGSLVKHRPVGDSGFHLVGDVVAPPFPLHHGERRADTARRAVLRRIKPCSSRVGLRRGVVW